MSCPVTIQTINGNECIGDSLPKIVGNFAALSGAACELYTRVTNLSSSISGPWKNISSAYTSINNDRIAANTSAGSFTITLPASPTFGTNVTIVDAQGTWDTNNLTIARNGSTIEGLAEDLTCDVEGDMVLTLLYNGSTWKVYA